jgi:hypothetical protein
MSLTGANSAIAITQAVLFPTAQSLQGFAADDVTDMDPVEIVEYLMGVDGVLSAGFTWKPRLQKIRLQADSASNLVFDTINNQSQAVQDVYALSATILLPAIGLKFTCSNGFLRNYKPMPAVKRLIQPRDYEIVWNSVIPALTG